MGEKLLNLWNSTGFTQGTWQNYVMLAIACVLFFLAIVKQFEPLLLLPIAFGMFCINIPGGQEVLMPIAQAKTEITAAINSNLALDGEVLKYLVTADSFVSVMNGGGAGLLYVLADGVNASMIGGATTDVVAFLSADGQLYNSAMQVVGSINAASVSDVLAMEKKLANAMKVMLGINPTVHLVAPKTIARSEGKAVRVIDKRKLI